MSANNFAEFSSACNNESLRNTYARPPIVGNPYGTEAPDPNTTSGLSARYS